MSHAPAHDLGRCAEDCILTTPAEWRELIALRVAFAVLDAQHRPCVEFTGCPDADSGFCHGCEYAWPCPSAAALAPVRELRGDPQ